MTASQCLKNRQRIRSGLYSSNFNKGSQSLDLYNRPRPFSTFWTHLEGSAISGSFRRGLNHLPPTNTAVVTIINKHIL